MATGTISAPTLDAIQQVLHAFETSNAQTQQDIQNLLGPGLGLSHVLQPATEVSSSLSITPVTGTRAAYDADFYAWTQEQAALLRQGAVHALDLTNLAEEIESLGKSDRRALGSHLRNLVMHLLKWQYQPSGRLTGHSWQSSIRNARAEIAVLLEDSHSLWQEVAELLARWYPLARLDAADETRLPLTTFPEACPWTPEQVLDTDFWPEGT
jgi:hypothetical protein